MDELAKQSAELAKQFAELAKVYGPKVVDLALQATQVEGFATLMSAAAGLAVGMLLLACAGWGGRFWAKHPDKNEGPVDFILIPVTVFGLVGLPMFGRNLYTLCDYWNWVAISHPEIYLAKHALGF